MTRIILRILSITLLVILLGTFLAVPVFAAGLTRGDVITISKGQVVDDDLYIAARSVIIDGTVNGDIFCAAQNIIINGTVNGGVTLAGSTVTITGTITNGARVAAQTINVSGNIGRDLFVAGSDVNITGEVKHDLVFGSATAVIGGSVDGNMKGGSNTATITGKIGGDVELWLTQLTLSNTAAIQGKLTYTSDKQAIVQSGAQINGTVTQIPQPVRSRGPNIGGRILGFFMIAVTGIIAILLIGSPRVTQIADSIRSKPWPSLGWGALLLFATPIAIIIIMITVIGIPLGLITLTLYLIALYLSQIPVALFIGRIILKGYTANQAVIRTMVALVLGLFLLLIVGFIPYLNALAGFLVILFGLGSLGIWLKSLKHSKTAQATTV